MDVGHLISPNPFSPVQLQMYKNAQAFEAFSPFLFIIATLPKAGKARTSSARQMVPTFAARRRSFGILASSGLGRIAK